MWRCPRPWWFMRTIFNKMIRAITIKTTLIIRRRFWSSRTVFNKMFMTATGITAFGTVSVSVIPRAVTLTRRVFGKVMTMTWRMRRSPWLTVTMPPVPIVLTFRTRWVATGRIMIRGFKNTMRNMVIRRVSVIFYNSHETYRRRSSYLDYEENSPGCGHEKNNYRIENQKIVLPG